MTAHIAMRSMLKRRSFIKAARRIFFLLVCLFIVSLLGCKGTSSVNPTSPELETPLPASSSPNQEEPDKDQTPVQSDGECDGFGETADDPNLTILEADAQPFIVTMDCAGDVDWYNIQLTTTPITLELSLTSLPDDSDFDMILYDSELNELGRSTQSGNVDESLVLVVEDSFLYVHIYSFSGIGEALLMIAADENTSGKESEEPPQEAPDEEPEIPDKEPEIPDKESETPDEELTQRSYEEVLATEFPIYPRGSYVGLLERSVETVVVQPIVCQLSNSEVSGEITIGNYAHVERDLLEAIDYVDGWALVVFNGSQELLDLLTITIEVTVFAPELDLDVTVPPDMEIQGNAYFTTSSGNSVYYISLSYGDFLGNSSNDIQISSGVVGELSDLFSNNIFTQQVEVEWQIEAADGTSCSGRMNGKSIIDFID